MPTTSNWEAAQDGIPGNLDATNHAAQVSQHLGTHNVTPVYVGSQLVITNTNNGGNNSTTVSYGNITDLSQPFTMPGGHTVTGRVTFPVLLSGAGADLTVSLYPDNGSGSPNTSNLLASTMVPQALLAQLDAYGTSPLSSARNTALYLTGGKRTFTWAPPTSGSFGASVTATPVQQGNYMISTGGIGAGAGTPATNVTTTLFEGTDLIALSVPQPALPVGLYLHFAAANSSFIAVGGGVTGAGFTNQAGVWTASWNSNTGEVGSWSAQSNLPQPVSSCSAAVFNNTVYVVGGETTSGTLGSTVNTVYASTVLNGQTQGWTVQPPLPVALVLPAVGVVDNFLIVAGGQDNTGTNRSEVYYSVIQADGSLSPWKNGPPLPQAGSVQLGGCSGLTTPTAFVVAGLQVSSGSSDAIQVLSVTPNGIADQWTFSQYEAATGTGNSTATMGLFNLGNGLYDLINMSFSSQSYDSVLMTTFTQLSVPLPATGLTPGNTYHVVIQQNQSIDASSFVSYGLQQSFSIASPQQALKSTRHSGTWAAAIPTSHTFDKYYLPIVVFDNTVSASPTPVLHTWEDPSSTGSTTSSNVASRSSTFVYNTNKLPVGLLDYTLLPNDPLNLNPTFATNVTNWTPHNCTFVQSNAQVHGGFSFSGLMTPTSGASPNVTSELIPIIARAPLFSNAQWFVANGWFFSPTGWATVTLSIDWYDSTRTFISTSNSTVSLTANTWQNLVSLFQAPSNAFFASINFIESGSPTGSNTVYFSDVALSLSIELNRPLASAAQITYGNSIWPPNGVTQLA